MSNEVEKIVPDTEQPVPKQRPTINKYGVQQHQGEPAVLKHEIFRSRDPFDTIRNSLIARVFKLRPDTSKQFANLDYSKMWKKARELNLKYPSQLITPEFNVVPYKEQMINYDIVNLRECNSSITYNRSTVVTPVPWEYTWRLIQSCIFVRVACNIHGIEWSTLRQWFDSQDRAHKLAMLDGIFSQESITSTDWFFLHIRRNQINTISGEMFNVRDHFTEEWIKYCDTNNARGGAPLNYRDSNLRCNAIGDCDHQTLNAKGYVNWNGTVRVNYDTPTGICRVESVTGVDHAHRDSGGLVKWLDKHLPRKFWAISPGLISHTQNSSDSKWSV